MNPNIFSFSIAHDHILEFKGQYWYYLLVFATSGDNYSFKKEAISSNRFSIINIFNIAVVKEVYNSLEFVILSVTYYFSSQYNLYNTFSLNVSKYLFSNMKMSSSRNWVGTTKWSNNKSDVWSYSTIYID